MTKEEIENVLRLAFSMLHSELVWNFQTERKDKDESLNIVDALFHIGDAILALSKSVDRLGLNGISDFGALELLSKEVREGLDSLSRAVDGINEK